ALADDFAVLAQQKTIQFSSTIATSSAKANISAAHLRSAVWNILDNALKFTPDGGWVKLDAALVNQHIQLSITDSGIGIAAEEMPKLFTKFHRGTSTMQYQYEGTGIGLYATKLVIERLGGTITAASQLGHGSTFTIQLPML
ncbi:MAG TPA: ATP-binding protein, partial [Candidatus Saccharimonadales bacterium]|nr:ATP-binding protein [Candidatus Saccharimonadales bacterium]